MEQRYFILREQALLKDRFEAYYQYPSSVPERGVTVNTLRCLPEVFAAQSGFLLQPSPFCANGYRLLNENARPGNHPYHHAGVFYVQEPSASAPAALLQVQPGHLVLDLCAAPGGKSSQLAAALKGQGLLVSNEYDSGRAQILRGNLERMGVANAVVLNETPDRIAEAMPGRFDRVLVDAPCSGEGMFRKEPQALTQHNAGLVAQCAERGKEILEAAARCLAVGGRMVYSTCTFAPEEDEGQIASFLHRHPEFELVDCDVSFGSPGEENRCGAYPADAAKMRRIWPFQGGEGHFMACLEKRDLGMQEEAPRSPKKKKGEKTPKPCQPWLEFAGQYFPALENMPVTLIEDRVLLGADPLKGRLHILRSGVLAGNLQKGRFVPEHHLFTAYGAQCENCERLALNDERTAAYLRGEEIPAQTAQNGWCSVLVDGFPMGSGKVSGGKIKNHLPKALRNLK